MRKEKRQESVVTVYTHTHTGVKSKRGITLVALIITIIVMLILAGITISMIVGEEGVINQAQNAETKQQYATAKERIESQTAYFESGENVGKVDLNKTKANIESLNLEEIEEIIETPTELTIKLKDGTEVKIQGLNGGKTKENEDDGILKYSYNGEEATVTGFKTGYEDTTELIIPKVVIKDEKEYQVTSIGTNAFYQCSNLSSAEMPNVMSIGQSAFNKCTSLSNVKIPKVTALNNFAFVDCTSLKRIELPNVLSIGSSVFDGCANLNIVELPSATSIGDKAFFGCDSLNCIEIPMSVITIGSYAFYPKSIIIYCPGRSSAGDGWSVNWNPYGCTVKWNEYAPK